MLNILKSDFYRLIRSKSFYICAAVAFGFNLLGLFISKWAANSNPQLQDMLPKSGMDYGVKALADNNALTIISIIVSIFVVAEFTHGTMKNVVSKGFSKTQVYLSKFITMLVASYLTILFVVVGGVIAATAITGSFGDFSNNFTVEFFKTLGIEMLLNAAFVAILVFISMSVRNLGGVIAINIIGFMSVAPALLMGLQYLVKNKVKFQTYELFYNMSSFTQGFGTATGSDYLRAAIVGVVFLVVATLLGILAFQKSDIK